MANLLRSQDQADLVGDGLVTKQAQHLVEGNRRWGIRQEAFEFGTAEWSDAQPSPQIAHTPGSHDVWLLYEDGYAELPAPLPVSFV